MVCHTVRRIETNKNFFRVMTAPAIFNQPIRKAHWAQNLSEDKPLDWETGRRSELGGRKENLRLEDERTLKKSFFLKIFSQTEKL